MQHLPALVWALLALWFLSRRYGQPIPLNPFIRRKTLHLNLGQNIFLGVSTFGVSVAILDLADRWLRLSLYGKGSFDRFVVGGAFVSALVGGILFGLVEAVIQSHAKQQL